jgi:hypothetical protein
MTLKKILDGIEGIRVVSREEALRACKPTDVALDWTSRLSADQRSFALLVDEEGGGIIGELGLGETPMAFDDDESLWKTWAELHSVFGVPLSEQDRDLLDLLRVEPEKSRLS